MHVALVGLMGAGKTTVGRRAAKGLGRPFVDSDEAFVPRYGRTVADVVAADGEATFRGMEAQLLGELLEVTAPLVVATGGGVVVTEANRERLAGAGVYVIYLHAEPTFLASRVQPNADRFLLAGTEAKEVLARLYDERDGWYRELADELIEVAPFHHLGSQPKRAIAARIVELAQAAGGTS